MAISGSQLQQHIAMKISEYAKQAYSAALEAKLKEVEKFYAIQAKPEEIEKFPTGSKYANLYSGYPDKVVHAAHTYIADSNAQDYAVFKDSSGMASEVYKMPPFPLDRDGSGDIYKLMDKMQQYDASTFLDRIKELEEAYAEAIATIDELREEIRQLKEEQ